jgi:hypothetical protein
MAVGHPKEVEGADRLCLLIGAKDLLLVAIALACRLALGVRKGSKTVIHGNTGTDRADECWLQHSCGDLRPYENNAFTLFKM